MKELERTSGIFLAWITGRLAPGDYDLRYTHTHDMAADIYTKGCNDTALFYRLRMLINVYFEVDLKLGNLRPKPLTVDKGDASLVEGFRHDDVTSQYQILNGEKSTRAADNKQAVGKSKKQIAACSFGYLGLDLSRTAPGNDSVAGGAFANAI